PASILAAQPARAAKLDVLWQADLGPSDRLIYRGAVCKNGTTFLADSSGRVVAISQDGKIAADTHIGIGIPHAAACSNAGELVLASAVGSAISLITVSSDPSQPPRSVELRTRDGSQIGPVHSMAIREDGT